MKFNWVTLNISDLDKSLAFYMDLLGLDISSRSGGGDTKIVFLGKDFETKLELIYRPDNKFENPGEGVAVGFQPEDLDGLVAKLKGLGYELEGPIAPNPDLRFFFVKDPDGFTVQLVEQK